MTIGIGRIDILYSYQSQRVLGCRHPPPSRPGPGRGWRRSSCPQARRRGRAGSRSARTARRKEPTDHPTQRQPSGGKYRGVYCSIAHESLPEPNLKSFPKYLRKYNFSCFFPSSSLFFVLFIFFSPFSFYPLFLPFLPHLLKSFPKGLEGMGIRNFMQSWESVVSFDNLNSKEKLYFFSLETQGLLEQVWCQARYSSVFLALYFYIFKPKAQDVLYKVPSFTF